VKDEGFFECDADLDTADFAALLEGTEGLGSLSAECQGSFYGTTPYTPIP
jgi:hypothetical protein